MLCSEATTYVLLAVYTWSPFLESGYTEFDIRSIDGKLKLTFTNLHSVCDLECVLKPSY